ncbi:hypothetical protein [Chitinophaga sp. ARDCPP14]|uniref:hypothetical protein n=1 Tax=Chitinophaga sp. ARDCPP14 TaxID=3391139 RepID=UPI003F520BFE
MPLSFKKVLCSLEIQVFQDMDFFHFILLSTTLMRALFIALVVTLKSTYLIAQVESSSNKNTPAHPLLIKSHNNEQATTIDAKVVYRSNAGYAKIYKITDSLYEFKAWENRIYLNRTNVEELKEAARMLEKADKDDKVSLTTFRCEITKGKMLGADVYWVELFKQKSMVDLSNLSPAEINAVLKSSDVSTVKDEKGEIVATKAKIVQYEEMIKRFGITNKDLRNIISIE